MANIRGWKVLTGGIFSEEEIEEGVYRSTLNQLSSSDNTFMRRLKTGSSSDLADFLLLAKEVEELREHIESPWYYPASHGEYCVPNDPDSRLHQLLDLCNIHMSGRLADRYALQAIRISRSLRDWHGCLNYYDAHLKSLPDNNLMKQMAQGYVAGCYMNLGDTVKADRMFALAGDFNCLSSPTAANIKYLAYNHPESDVLKFRLNGFIGYCGPLRNLRMLEIADAALRSPKVVNRGDWLYLKAFIQCAYAKNYRKAEILVKQALNQSFSKDEMKADARYFDVCISAKNGNFNRFTENAEWMISKYGNYRQGVLFFIVPALLKHGKTSQALLLANIMDRDKPYASTGFQMLMSSTPEQIIRYKEYVTRRPDSFSRLLGDSVIANCDYLNDIIGTLYLRKGDYSRGVSFLSQVSEQYQRSTNLYKNGCLAYNPWDYAYLPESQWDYPGWEYDSGYEWTMPLRPVVNKDRVTKLTSQLNAKLNFAEEMARLQNIISHASDKDERNLARLRFAIGRYNSFNTCWALTQYWCGGADQCNYQPFYWNGGDEVSLDYIIDTPREMVDIENWFLAELNDSYAKLNTEAAKATANMILRNYRTIARRYPNSIEGKYLATHCDRWSDWL